MAENIHVKGHNKIPLAILAAMAFGGSVHAKPRKRETKRPPPPTGPSRPQLRYLRQQEKIKAKWARLAASEV